MKTFHFSIYTYIYQLNNHIPNENDYPSNDDIQQSFYSIPFQFKTFMRLSSSFTGDIFTYVRTLSINDYVSCDYHFFNNVNQSFPLIEILMICNSSPQENNSQLNNNFEQFPIVTFSRLIDLHIIL